MNKSERLDREDGSKIAYSFKDGGHAILHHKGHKFIQHEEWTREWRENGDFSCSKPLTMTESNCLYAFWGGQVLTESEIIELLAGYPEAQPPLSDGFSIGLSSYQSNKKTH